MLFAGYTPYSKILNHAGKKIGYISIKQNSVDKSEIFFSTDLRHYQLVLRMRAVIKYDTAYNKNNVFAMAKS